MIKPFSYLAVLSLVAKRAASLDGTATEMNALIAHLLGVPTIVEPISHWDMEKARERLFTQFPRLDPMEPGMVMHYGTMLECLEVVHPNDVRYYMIGWASKTKDEMGLPSVFDVDSEEIHDEFPDIC